MLGDGSYCERCARHQLDEEAYGRLRRNGMVLAQRRLITVLVGVRAG